MVRFVHISDPHFNTDYSNSRISPLNEKTGLTLTERLIAAVGHINENYPETDFFLLTGDLVYNGTVEEYAVFRALMDGLTGGRPCYVALGNHDTDSFWRGWLGISPGGSYNRAVVHEKSGLKIISLDSRGGPYGSGSLSRGQLDWLRYQLSEGGPSILLLHHTPHIGDIEYLRYQMPDSRALYDTLRDLSILGIFTGHTHMRFESMFGAIPCHTAPSVTFGIVTDLVSMTLTDKTGYNYCVFSDGKLTVENVDLPGAGAKMRYDYNEINWEEIK